tara:strand:- start:3159 stop:5123 length:1965 start_codon:yes stop_codon:yes gene_type:complete
LGLESLRSLYAEGLGNNTPAIGGRHSTTFHPGSHSLLDEFVGMSPTPNKTTKLINILGATPNKTTELIKILGATPNKTTTITGFLGATPSKQTPIYDSIINTNLTTFDSILTNFGSISNSNLLIQNSTYDDFTVPFPSGPGVGGRWGTGLLSQETQTNTHNPFPTNYTAQNTIVAGEFTNENNGLKEHGWFDLYNSNHTSLKINQPSPRSSNPFQRFQYGNPNINTNLNIKSGEGATKGEFGFSRGNEPYIVSEIGGEGRRTNKGNRILPFGRAKTDFKRIGKYMLSPSGLLELALKNANLLNKTVTIRDGDELKNKPLRFNAGFSPLSLMGAVGARLLGQGMPNFLFSSGFSKGYSEAGNLFDFPKIPGDDPTNFKLNDTFTGANQNVFGKKIDNQKEVPFFNFKGVVAKVTNGDKMTLAQIIQGDSLDTTEVGTTKTTGDKADKVNFAVDGKKDGMPFYFKDLRDNSYIFFRAYLEGISEEISPSWSEHNYIGRSEPVYVYERATRSISFTLKLAAQTEQELNAIYVKMNRLTSLCYPEYAQDIRLNKTRMKPPITKLRLGDLFGKSNNEMMGFIESLSYVVPDESTWETKVGKRVPKHITATIGYKVIHGKPPELYKDNSNSKPFDFYGFGGSRKTEKLSKLTTRKEPITS